MRIHRFSIPQRTFPVLRLLLLVGVVIAIWCVIFDRLSWESWQTPISYSGDAWFYLAWAKSAEDGNFWPVLSKEIPTLGAPFAANWNDHPVTEDLLCFFMGVVSRWVGLFAASNLVVLFSHILAAISFYACCRLLKCRWEWSLMGALVFGFSPYSFSRGLDHVVLTYDWHVPLGLLVSWWLVSRHGVKLGSRRYWLALGVAFATGLQNPYYTYIFLQFVGLAFLIHLVRRSPWQKLIAPVAVGLVAVLAFLLMNIDTLTYQAVHGGNPSAVVRTYADVEFYALKPVELFVPPKNHRSKLWSEVGERYYASTCLPGEGTNFPPYFGIVGIGSLTLLGCVSLRRAVRRPARPIPVPAWQAMWVLLYSGVGGLNGLAGLTGLILVRCTNRYSIVILALVLLFLVQYLSVICRRRGTWTRIAIASAITLVAFWDQLPPRTQTSRQAAIRQTVASDRAFTAAMEQRLPSRSMIFQLPVMDFPEVPPFLGVGDYEHFRPYLFSKHLHFSYGDTKGRSAGAWQHETGQLRPAEMVTNLEEYGFSAVYVNRKGYADKGVGFIEGLRAAGRPEKIEDSMGDLVCVILNPSSRPVLPKPVPIIIAGWHQIEKENGHTWRWSTGNAKVFLTNPSDASVVRYLHFNLGTLVPRRVSLMRGHGTLGTWSLTPGALHVVVNLFVTLNPGDNLLDFITDAPSASPGYNDPRRLAFSLHDFLVTEQPRATP